MNTVHRHRKINKLKKHCFTVDTSHKQTTFSLIPLARPHPVKNRRYLLLLYSHVKNVRRALVWYRVRHDTYFAKNKSSRNIYCPIILRERSAATLCRFWRCALARSRTRHRRQTLVLALLVNPLARGFLGRAATRRAYKEHYRKQQAILMVRVLIPR